MLTFFELLKFRNKLNVVISHINFISKYHGKCKFVEKIIKLVTIPNSFLLEFVQKSQHCQLCVLWENSNVSNFISDECNYTRAISVHDTGRNIIPCNSV